MSISFTPIFEALGNQGFELLSPVAGFLIIPVLAALFTTLINGASK